MRNVPLYDEGGHKFILLNESEPGAGDGVRSNQYLVVHDGHAAIMDPGGFGVMPRVLAELLRHTDPEQLLAIFLSHQDPDIVGGIATWLEITQARVFVSKIWLRFLPHYGIATMERFTGVEDAGMWCELKEGFRLQLIPAHFLHSEGQINIYDPVSKGLFSGDIGASVAAEEYDAPYVEDFAAHLPNILYFHQRYMGSNRAARRWVEAVSRLDIDFIAPQHGPVYRGQAMRDFLDWFHELPCGIDLMRDDGSFELTPKP